MTLEIRAATVADLPAVLQLYQQSGLDSDASLPLAAAEQWLQQLEQYPSYTLWVAVLAEKVAGTFTLLIMDNLIHQGSPSGVVEAVAVDPQWQGQGIGKQMIQFAIAQCRTAGCYKLALSTNLKRDRAHAFYQSLGFKKHGYSFLVEL
ncbi:GNAT family N-acetyltransferase [Almyronema epifaneia]|uniref:GNAT family N-acetyltransferase n=1 Tax=Almyronema epifaneia S1 TaxID=2991925 RepID=A0ABW6IKB9_9CYAN